MNPRHYTNQLLEMIEQGLIEPEAVILACVKYMSESEVKDMMRVNEFLLNENEKEQ